MGKKTKKQHSVKDGFLKKFELNAEKTIKRFSLLNKKDRVLVAASGGKDSTTVLYLLKKFGYNIEALTIDTSIGEYTKQNLENIKRFCAEQKIKLYIVSFKKEFGYSTCYIKSILKSKGIDLKSCTICGVLRRYLLNKYAKKLKADKLVTGHNLDDEAESVMINIFRNTLWLAARLGPKTSANEHFVQRIKPLYLTPKKEVIRYSKLMKFPVKYGACPCSSESYRRFVRGMLDEWELKNPKIKRNIINYFFGILPKLKQAYTNKNLSTCEKCGEPSSNKLCRACEIVGKL